MEKSPLDKVLDQIAEIIQYAYDNAHKPISPQKEKEMESQLAELEAQVQTFKKLNDLILEGSGLNDYVFQTMLEDDKNEKITEQDRALLKRAEVLKTEAEKASKDTLKASNEARASGKRLTEKKKQKAKSPQARKGKFKSMGGYKDWKPL